MASLVVASLVTGTGGLVAGSAYAIAAGAAASYIDSALIFPALFGGDLTEPPKVADVSVTGANEGGQIAMCIGPQVRIPISIIWAKNDPIVVYNNQSGGKGGGGSSATQLSYFTHVTYAACRAPVAVIDDFDDGIVEISRVWLDGKSFYDKNVDVDLAVAPASGSEANSLGVEVSKYLVEHAYTGPSGPSGISYYVRHDLLAASTTEGTDYARFRTGNDVTVTGFANPDNDITVANNLKALPVASTGFDPVTNFKFVVFHYGTIDGDPTSIFYTPPASWDDVVATGVGVDGIASGGEAVYDQNNEEWPPDEADFLTVRLGSHAQAGEPGAQSAHSWETDQEGIGNVPAYRGLATISVKRLSLAKYGNRIPTGHALVTAHSSLNLSQAIRIICLSFSDLVEADFDTSTLTGITFRGYAIQGRQTAAQMLQPIMIAYDIIMVEVDNQILFLKRSEAPTLAVDVNSLGARRDGGEFITNVAVKDTASVKLPDRVLVKYIDPDNGWQVGTTSERHPNAGSSSRGGEVLEINLPITLTEQEARQIAQRVLYDPVGTRRSLTITLMPSEVGVSEGSLVSFTVDGHSYLMLIDKLDRGSDFSYKAEGIAEYVHLRALPEIGTETGGAFVSSSGSSIYVPPVLLTSIFNAPALTASQALVPALTTATCAFQYEVEWRGAALLRNNPAVGTTYTQIQLAATETTMGRTISVLPAATNTSVINHDAFVDVELHEGELASVTAQEFLDGTNIVFLGEECISFQTATVLQGNQYRLSILRRGLKGTEVFSESEAPVGTIFVLADGTLNRTEYTPSLLGQARNYKAVPHGGDQGDYDEVSIVTTGRNAIYWEQAHVRGQRAQYSPPSLPVDNAAVIIKWNRTSRIRGTLFRDAPDFESVHLYRVRIYSGAGVPAAGDKRVDTIISIGSTGATEYVYSSADQASHGNGGTNQFSVIINRVGDFGHSPYNDHYAILPNL